MILSAKRKSTHSEITKSLLKQINMIAEEIYLKKDTIIDNGLLEGKAGITLLYAYLFKLFPEKKIYAKITSGYIEELSNALANNQLGYNMSSGIPGIAFVFQHLRNISIIDASHDLNLSELDKFINRITELDFQLNNWDPLHGMVGLGNYFLERNKETNDKKYLERIIDRLNDMKTVFGEYTAWITPGLGKISNDNYNFGMAHGIPGVLSFFAQVHRRGIRQHEIEKIILSSVPYLLENEYANPDYCFPTFVDVKPQKSELFYPRLGWCYGDLCVANALIHCGKALQKKDWLNKGIEVAVKTTHRTLENSGCVDASFCHGSAGLLHQYNRLYQLTNHRKFKASCKKWLTITLQHFYKSGENGSGYYFNSLNKKKNSFELVSKHGLLEGDAGIALVFLSYLFNIKSEWDIIFQSNI